MLIVVVVAGMLATSTAALGVTKRGTTRATDDFGRGSWRLTATRLDARRIRLSVRFEVRVRQPTAIHFPYGTCSGTRKAPRCANERSNRLSRQFSARPGRRIFRYRVIVSYPAAGVRTTCVIAQVDDVRPGNDGIRILGPSPVRARMGCPR